MSESIKAFNDQPEISGYEDLIVVDNKVQTLDPLSLDRFFDELPILNENHNVQEMINIIRSLDLSLERLNLLSTTDALASVRDLNMILSSLRRWDYDINQVPEIEQALIILSQRTKEVPTDTVFSYGTRNPNGERIRTFTSLPEEKLFIESFRSGMTNLPFAIKALEDMMRLTLIDTSFAEKAREAQKSFEEMVQTIINVRRKITPELFTHQLRPFFEPKSIGGKKYQAAGGAQMPIVLIDQILWGSDIGNEIYKKYFDDNMQYQPLFLRQKAELFTNRQSLLNRILHELTMPHANKEENTTTIKNSLSAVYDLLTFIEKFRRPHLKIAEENLQIRPIGSVGSGGYDLEILHFLLNNVIEAKKKISEALNNH